MTSIVPEKSGKAHEKFCSGVTSLHLLLSSTLSTAGLNNFTKYRKLR